MQFSEQLEQFILERDGLIFAWDEQPEEGYLQQVETISQNYRLRLDDIVRFMQPDLAKRFGNLSAGEIKEKLGKPVIDYENGRVTYLEQSFDETHIFTLEYWDDSFLNLRYFSIDG